MPPLLQATSVPLEFLSWFACWIVLMALQRRLCRCHPGLRTVCRMIFLWTLVVAVVPGVWTLIFTPGHGPRVLALVNHSFGLGVFAQTALRSLAMVRWLAWPVVQVPVSERYVLGALLALTQALRPPGKRQVSSTAAR